MPAVRIDFTDGLHEIHEIDSAEDVDREGHEYTIHTKDGKTVSYPMDRVQSVEIDPSA